MTPVRALTTQGRSPTRVVPKGGPGTATARKNAGLDPEYSKNIIPQGSFWRDGRKGGNREPFKKKWAWLSNGMRRACGDQSVGKGKGSGNWLKAPPGAPAAVRPDREPQDADREAAPRGEPRRHGLVQLPRPQAGAAEGQGDRADGGDGHVEHPRAGRPPGHGPEGGQAPGEPRAEGRRLGQVPEQGPELGGGEEQVPAVQGRRGRARRPEAVRLVSRGGRRGGSRE